jgi:23S rRNA maturation-related 3'-5' exoribonuclease YhaM
MPIHQNEADNTWRADVSDMQSLRAGVRESLPELALIASDDLRDKVVEAWALALSETEYKRIEDMKASGNPETPALRRGTQADHLRATCLIAVGMAEGMERIFGDIGISHDVLIAGALVHDVGKPFECSERNRARWRANPSAAGRPAIRHPVYGVHVALAVGLPESVAHIVGGHSMFSEGAHIIPSLENTIVQFADLAMWKIADAADLFVEKMWIKGKLNEKED